MPEDVKEKLFEAAIRYVMNPGSSFETAWFEITPGGSPWQIVINQRFLLFDVDAFNASESKILFTVTDDMYRSSSNLVDRKRTAFDQCYFVMYKL